MGFSARQTLALRRNLDHRQVRTRELHGRELSYIEGWYAISEANRIFGFDGWSRETIDSKCVLARENRGTFLAVYIARVRITVQANGATVIREGHGTGEGHGTSPGEVHDIALKAAETDATKRALATFGKPFGLALYGSGKAVPSPRISAPEPEAIDQNRQPVRLPPDDTTPIPRPSTYYGRRQDLVTRERAQGRRELQVQPTAETSIVPRLARPRPRSNRQERSGHCRAETAAGQGPSQVRRLTTLSGLRAAAVRSASSAFCATQSLGLKVSDEFTVPLCRGHHRQLHQAGNEVAWWQDLKINALEIAKGLWEKSRRKILPTVVQSPPLQTPSDPPQPPLQRDASKSPNEAN